MPKPTHNSQKIGTFKSNLEVNGYLFWKKNEWDLRALSIFARTRWKITLIRHHFGIRNFRKNIYGYRSGNTYSTIHYSYLVFIIPIWFFAALRILTKLFWYAIKVPFEIFPAYEIKRWAKSIFPVRLKNSEMSIDFLVIFDILWKCQQLTNMKLLKLQIYFGGHPETT